nr:MAG TPA: hypothetical protein [Caudoviricetes sp.]
MMTSKGKAWLSLAQNVTCLLDVIVLLCCG